MEDELIKIWQSSPKVEQIKFEKSRLMLNLESSLARLQRGWKNMQLRETIAAVIVVPVFIYRAFVAEQILVKIGAIWIVISTVYIIYRLISTKKYKPNTITESYLDSLNQSKDYLSIQKNLLDSVIYWYFLPIAIGALLILIGSWEISSMMSPRNWKIIAMVLVIVASGWGIHFLNRWSANKYIAPRLKKIDELIEVMEE